MKTIFGSAVAAFMTVGAAQASFVDIVITGVTTSTSWHRIDGISPNFDEGDAVSIQFQVDTASEQLEVYDSFGGTYLIENVYKASNVVFEANGTKIDLPDIDPMGLENRLYYEASRGDLDGKDTRSYVLATVGVPGFVAPYLVAGIEFDLPPNHEPDWAADLELARDFRQYDSFIEIRTSAQLLGLQPGMRCDNPRYPPRSFNRCMANIEVTSFQFQTANAPAPIPLPASAWLLLAGLGGLGMIRGRKGRL